MIAVIWDFAYFALFLGVLAIVWCIVSSGADCVTVTCQCGMHKLRRARFVREGEAEQAADALTAQCDTCAKATAQRMFPSPPPRPRKTTMHWTSKGYDTHHDQGAPRPTLEINA